MNADIHTLYSSDFYRVLDFKCRCTDCSTSKPEYSESFSISFIRKGNFVFNVFRNSLDSYNGCVLITKPGYERTVTHRHTTPDECTIFDFKREFYPELLDRYSGSALFRNNDIHAALLKTHAHTELLHFHIMQFIKARSAKLNIDSLVIDFVNTTLSNISDYRTDSKITQRLKANHLITIERAKEYITQNFTNDISLREIADHCYISPFHFSRVFKALTSYSPHQFLLSVRLKNADILLRNTSSSISEISFKSGFNSVAHFTNAFRSKYGSSPSRFRSEYNTTF
ncbi:helix-turn-helix transcriptional regulator [Maribacter sp.]